MHPPFVRSMRRSMEREMEMQEKKRIHDKRSHEGKHLYSQSINQTLLLLCWWLLDSRSPQIEKMGVHFFCFRVRFYTPRYYDFSSQRYSLRAPTGHGHCCLPFFRCCTQHGDTDDDSSFVLLIRWICLFYNCCWCYFWSRLLAPRRRLPRLSEYHQSCQSLRKCKQTPRRRVAANATQRGKRNSTKLEPAGG